MMKIQKANNSGIPAFMRNSMAWSISVLALIIAPLMLAPTLILPDQVPQKPSLAAAKSVSKADARKSKGLKANRHLTFTSPVARVFRSSLPEGIADTQIIREKKRLFLETMVPIVLRANEMLLDQRQFLLDLRQRQGNLSVADLNTLQEMERLYRVTPGSDGRDGRYFRELLARVDIVPPSLAITQAAIESGWGTSRFARLGNALFGEWTWDKNASGMDPLSREAGKVHRIKTFDHLLESVISYMTNLNRHPAYQAFRDMRVDLRANGTLPEGRELAKSLVSYSERGNQYVEDVVQIMDYNGFGALDDITLEKKR